MSDQQISLGTFQRWMRSVVIHPGSDAEAWMSDEAQREIALPRALEFVESSPSLSQMERVGIYRRMYFLRMRESLRIDYPGVAAALGPAGFDPLVQAYCQVHPSSSYTLNHLGRSLPAFIAAAAGLYSQELAELARLELALTELLEADRVDALTGLDLRSAASSGLESLELRTVPGFRLVQLEHPHHEFLRAAYDDQEAPFPPPARMTYLLLYLDEDFDVIWKELTHPQFVLLSSFHAGTSVSSAMDRLSEAFPADADALAGSVGAWLQEWIEAGYFLKPDGKKAST